jgi:transposase
MHSIGLDISKSTIAVYIPLNDQHLEIENNTKGIKGLYTKLKKLYKKEIRDLVFVYEPTGNYSVLLTKFCHAQLIQVFMINPKQSHNYAKAIGARNKSDKADAYILSKAIVVAKENDITVPNVNETQEAIKELMSYYKFTVKQRVKANNHLEAITAKEGNRYVINDLNKRIKTLRKQEKEILEQIHQLIQEDKVLQQGFENIQSIVGVGEIAAIVLLHLFIKYPDANQKQIVSLTGLDPIERSSGTSVNKRPKISKAGAKLYRGSLFMSVLTAIRFNEPLQHFFNRLKAQGKHTTVAQIAVMRKLVIIAHALYKNNQVFDYQKYQLAVGKQS